MQDYKTIIPKELILTINKSKNFYLFLIFLIIISILLSLYIDVLNLRNFKDLKKSDKVYKIIELNINKEFKKTILLYEDVLKYFLDFHLIYFKKLTKKRFYKFSDYVFIISRRLKLKVYAVEYVNKNGILQFVKYNKDIVSFENIQGLNLKKYPDLYNFFVKVLSSNKVLFYRFFKMKNGLYATALSIKCCNGMLSILIDEKSFLKSFTLNGDFQDFFIVFTDDKLNILFSNLKNSNLEEKSIKYLFNKKLFKDLDFKNFSFVKVPLFKSYIWIFPYEKRFFVNSIVFYSILVKVILLLFALFLIYIFYTNYKRISLLEEISALKLDYDYVLSRIDTPIFLFDKKWNLFFYNDKARNLKDVILNSNYVNELKEKLQNKEFIKFLNKEIKDYLFDIFAYSLKRFYFILILDKTELKEVKEKRDIEIIKKDKELTFKSVKLLQYNVQIQELLNSKLEFLASISHDIRNPLNAIISCVDIIKKERKVNNELIEIMNLNTKKLLDYINNLIKYAKIEKNLYTLKLSYIDISSLIKSIALSFKPFFVNKKVKFLLDIPDKLEKIETDKDKLTEIIENLLSNAIKYTESGYIKLQLKKIDEKGLEIIVEDTGKGISEKSFNKIFSPFYQENPGSEGFGLGLAIVKNNVKFLGGDFEIKNKKNGKGVIAKVFLPF